MELLKALNLGLRFVLELCMLLALAFACYHLFQNQWMKWLAAVGLPLIAATIWGIFIAPKSPHLLQQPFRLIIELVLFGSASWLLYVAGYQKVALVFLAAVLVNELLLYIWKQ